MTAAPSGAALGASLTGEATGDDVVGNVEAAPEIRTHEIKGFTEAHAAAIFQAIRGATSEDDVVPYIAKSRSAIKAFELALKAIARTGAGPEQALAELEATIYDHYNQSGGSKEAFAKSFRAGQGQAETGVAQEQGAGPERGHGGRREAGPAQGGIREGAEAGTDAVRKAQEVDQAASVADPNPTAAQKESGNYRMGHVTIDGLDVSIENARGSVRSGVGPDGKPWSAEMPAHYGYVRGTEGHDGDHVDVYIGPDPGGFRKVWVVDQIDPGTKKFDEHKALIGFDSKPEAMAAYLGGFSDNSGAGRIGEITEMTKEDFVDWVNEGNTEKPLAYGRKRFSQRIDTSANLGPDERYTSERLPSEAAAALGEGNLQPAADVARRVHQAVEASGEAKPKTRDERFKLNKRIKAREAEALADWARRNNLLLNDSEFERKWIEGDRISGQEADVYFDKASKRVIKLSHADLTGSGSVGQSGDVLAYLRGLQLQNELFADDTRLEGLVRLDGELPQIVTSQGFKTSSSLAPASLASFHADTLGPPPQARLCSSSRLEANG